MAAELLAFVLLLTANLPSFSLGCRAETEKKRTSLRDENELLQSGWLAVESKVCDERSSSSTTILPSKFGCVTKFSFTPKNRSLIVQVCFCPPLSFGVSSSISSITAELATKMHNLNFQCHFVFVVNFFIFFFAFCCQIH